jgi:glycosyltransferase involved in cell wall biosynthesis
MKFAYRLLYRYADCIFCSSEKMSTDFINNFNVPKSLIKILPNPINEKEIRSKSLPALSRDGNAVHFVAAGRLTYQKGFDRLIEWFATLDKEKYTLTILGEGPLMKSLSNSINHLDLEKQVILAGFSSNPWQWYAGADVFLLCSRWEGMPNAALESLACGTPVIATYDSGGIQEVAECSPNGAVTLVKNSSQFIEAMKGINQKNQTLIKESFLPRKYEILSVISVLESMLKENNI